MASILAVDDSASMRQMVAFTLKGAGYQVLEAADGVEALSIAKGQGVNLVITDVNMPRMDGISLIKELRALPSYRFTPLLMLLRMSTPESVPWWQPVLGLMGVLICAILAVWLGGRIFRIGILSQGKMPKLSQILRWALSD